MASLQIEIQARYPQSLRTPTEIVDVDLPLVAGMSPGIPVIRTFLLAAIFSAAAIKIGGTFLIVLAAVTVLVLIGIIRRYLIDRRRHGTDALVIDLDGIFDKRVTQAPIRWRDITKCFPEYAIGQMAYSRVILTVSTPVEVTHAMFRGARLNFRREPNEVDIPLTNLSVNPNILAVTITTLASRASAR